MNQEEIRQVTARDEKWVPTKEKVKIGTTNVRLEPTCVVDAEVFRKILNIFLRVQGEDFTEVPDDETTLSYLINLGYKGPLHKNPSIYVDHMHQPWITLAAIINKCLSGITTSNDRLRKSRIDILWGMFYKENVNYPELIWEDFAFQIDHRMEKQRRRENMPYPKFTKININHFLSQHKSLANLKHLHTHLIKDDDVVSRLKFVRIGEDFQEYRLPITETMLTEKIKQSESYQMFIKYSIGLIPPKKSRGSRRVINKKVSISADDNIIPEPDVALELGKSMSLTEAAEEEAARDTSCVLKKMSPDSSQKLKGVQTLTPEEKLAADTMQALKE
ncbi:hypothetical protein Tco_1247804, partial [Tanacetum coccineum]